MQRITAATHGQSRRASGGLLHGDAQPIACVQFRKLFCLEQQPLQGGSWQATGPTACAARAAGRPPCYQKPLSLPLRRAAPASRWLQATGRAVRCHADGLQHRGAHPRRGRPLAGGAQRRIGDGAKGGGRGPGLIPAVLAALDADVHPPALTGGGSGCNQRFEALLCLLPLSLPPPAGQHVGDDHVCHGQLGAGRTSGWDGAGAPRVVATCAAWHRPRAGPRWGNACWLARAALNPRPTSRRPRRCCFHDRLCLVPRALQPLRRTWRRSRRGRRSWRR